MEIKLHSVINDAELFKCNEYDFTSKSEQGLKTHIKRKHTKIVIPETIPNQCELCEKEFKDKKDKKEMNIHMKPIPIKELNLNVKNVNFVVNQNSQCKFI